MEINVRDDKKIVEIWLANAEKQNIELHEKLKTLYQSYKAKKYCIAVMVSGSRDLGDATSNLICYNRKRIAQLEAAEGKTAESTTTFICY